jgi:hypothetical protein
MAVPGASPNDDFADFEDAFFQSSEASVAADSMAPTELERPAQDEPSKDAQVARRVRLQKVVGLVVGASAVATLFVLARVHAARPALPSAQPAAEVPRSSGPVAASAALARNELAPVSFPPPGIAPAAAVAPVAAPIPEASAPLAPVAAVAPVAAPIPEASAPLAPAAPKEMPVPTLDVEQTKARALRAVSSGRYTEGMALSQAAIDADPTDAQGYLLLGAALQEKGQEGKAMQVFAECALKATHGPKGDCRALAKR